MRFFNWIEKQGVREVARMVGTESNTVWGWTSRKASPRAVVMQRLVELGKGEFDFNDIINDTKTPAQKKRAMYGAK